MAKQMDLASELAHTLFDNPQTYNNLDDIRELMERLIRETKQEDAVICSDYDSVWHNEEFNKGFNKARDACAKAIEESI